MSTFQREWFIIFLEIPTCDISPCIKIYLDLLEKSLQTFFSDPIISWGLVKIMPVCVHSKKASTKHALHLSSDVNKRVPAIAVLIPTQAYTVPY
jgi:hypothetical protein